jgi:hypothetical protein
MLNEDKAANHFGPICNPTIMEEHEFVPAESGQPWVSEQVIDFTNKEELLNVCVFIE